MASYKVVLKPSVEKDLRSLPKSTIVRVIKQIDGLATEPFPSQTLKLEGGEDLYRIRVGDYRVKTIHHVRHRREAYRKL